jgi:hypothetical protein
VNGWLVFATVVARIDGLFFALCCLLMMASLLGLFAASRISASFTPRGIEINHALRGRISKMNA